MQKDETGWLVELPLIARSGGMPHWVAFKSHGVSRWRTVSDDGDDWRFQERDFPLEYTPDSNAALRFSRKQDAEAFIKAFDRFLLHAVATEHMWMGERTPVACDAPITPIEGTSHAD